MESTSQTCAYHPDRTATATCSECHSPICEECRQEVAGQVVCAKCVNDIRSRVAAELESERPPVEPSNVPQPVTTFPAPPVTAAPAAQTSAPAPSSAPIP